MSKIYWDILLNYESYDLIKRKYTERHGVSPNSGQVKEINSCFIQAREYFTSANKSERIVKPLLLYYGVMNLSKGAILFLKRGLREGSLSASHGLSTKDWANSLNQPNYDISNLSITVNKKGTLPEFMEASDNTSLLRINSSALNYKYKHSNINHEFSLSLQDLISRLPELRDHYIRWQGLPKCLLGGVTPDSNNNLVFNLQKNQNGILLSPDDVQRLFENYYPIIQETTEQYNFILNKPATLPIFYWDEINESMLNIGKGYLVLTFPNQCDISKTISTYILSYFLGMLVRYFPSKWMSLMRNELGDASLPTLLKGISFIEHQYPMMIVDLLEVPDNIPYIGQTPKPGSQ